MRSRRRFIPIILFCLAVSAGVLAFTHLNTQNFISDTITSFYKPIQKGLFTAVTTKNNSSTIAKLQDENSTLRKKIVDQEELEKENIALHDQFQLTSIPTKHLMPAKIVGSPGFVPGVTFPEEIIIDRGSRDGVKEDMPVIYKEMLVGLVSRVTSSDALVTFASAKSSSFTAETLNKKAFGVIKGQGNGEIIFDNVLLSQQLARNDIIVTKGSVRLDGTGYPPGLVIGKIKSIEKNPSALFQKANIEPVLNFVQLSTVFIITER